ncbi:hypothetical protein FACS1894187_24330 [Synergistales bacterium]|nr:hypothetical protein FACS1894187_24330 [Synergistales bacterium]
MSAKNMPPSIDRIVKEVCFEDLYSQISQRMTRNPYLLNFRPNHSDIDEVRLSYVELIQVKNANIQENHVSFDAVVKCDMDVDIVERGYDVRRRSNSMTQWLKVRCELALSEEGDNFNFAVERIEDYSKDRNTSKATVSLVPVVYKKDLDKEATDFLQKHCPEALTTPMAVSIKDIAKNRMGLKVLTYRLTEDFSVFGQMCFQKGFAQIYDKDEDEYRAQEVEAGT